MVGNELLTRSFMIMTFSAAAVLLSAQIQQRIPIRSNETNETLEVVSRSAPRPSASPSRDINFRPTPFSLAALPNRMGLPLFLGSTSPAATQSSQPSTQKPAQPPPTRLLVDLSDRTVKVYRGNQLMRSYPVAVGQDGWETPSGTFQVTLMEKDPLWEHPLTGEVFPPGPKNPLGSRWIGFWSGPQYEIGFHGTSRPDLIGLAVSHGCLRMHESDIQDLYRYVQVGTEVTVRP